MVFLAHVKALYRICRYDSYGRETLCFFLPPFGGNGGNIVPLFFGITLAIPYGHL